jgi:hypothetical protein
MLSLRTFDILACMKLPAPEFFGSAVTRHSGISLH